MPDIGNAKGSIELVFKTEGARSAVQALRDVQTEAEKTDKSVQNLADQSGIADKAIAGVGDALTTAFAATGIALSAAAVGKAIGDVAVTAMEADSAMAKLEASTGATGQVSEQYRDTMLQIKADNFGETYDDLADAMGRVVQVMGQLDASTLRDVTEAALTLEDTFGSDFNETVRGADAMMVNFGLSAQEAFDLLAAGSKEGLDISDELGDNMAEYSQVWAEMGFSARDTFRILKNGLDAGAYNLDKVNDFVKEFGISLKDGRMDDNVEKFSKNTQKLFKAWKDGRATTKDVFTAVIADLKGMGTESTEAATLASDMWSALGEDNAMKVITSLDDVNTAFDNVTGAMEEMENVRYDSLSGNLQTIKEGLQRNLIDPIMDTAIPALTSLTGAIASVFEEEEDTTHTAAFVDGVTAAVGEAQTAVEEFKQNVDKAFDAYDSEMANAAKVEALTSQLESLNSITGRNASQQAILKTVVQELGEYIPEVTEAWNEQAGTLDLTAEKLEKLKTAAVSKILEDANASIMETAISGGYKAQLELETAQEKLESMTAQKDAIEEFGSKLQWVFEVMNGSGNSFDPALYKMLFDDMDTLDELMNKGGATAETYAGFLAQLPDPMAALDAALENGNITLKQRNELEAMLAEVERKAGDELSVAAKGVSQYNEKSKQLEKDQKTHTKTVEEFEKEIDNLCERYEAAGGDGEELRRMLKDYAAEQKAAAERTKFMATAQTTWNKATDFAVGALEKMGIHVKNVKGATDDLKESEDKALKTEEELEKEREAAAKAAEASAKRIETAASTIYNSYHGTYEKIKGELMNFDMSQFTADKEGEWEAPESVDSSRLAYNLIEYGNYLKQYKDNMRKLQEELGEDDPFYQHLVEMGPEYSGVVQGLIDGTEDALRVAQSTYNDIFEETDQTAKEWAAEQTALAAAMGQFGSSSIDYSNLRNSVANGFAGASEAAKSKFDDLVDYCQGVGAQIPDDLALGIQAGTVTVEDATAQMQDQLYGQLQGMRQIAQDLGIALPAELATGITENSSSAEMADAVASLYQTLTGANVDVQSEMEKKASEAGQGMTNGLTKEQETIKAAASANVQAALGTLTAGSVMFTMAGSANGKAYAAGLSLTEPDARRAGDSLGAAFADAMEQAILQRQEQIRLAVSSLVGSGELSEQITLETGNDAGSIGAAVGEALARTPMKTTVNVEMQDGDVVMDGERVGRHVAPTVSRVLAQRV